LGQKTLGASLMFIILLDVYACDIVEVVYVFVAVSTVWKNYFFNSSKSAVLSLKEAVAFVDWQTFALTPDDISAPFTFPSVLVYFCGVLFKPNIYSSVNFRQ
jgi:hypothetical protein